MTLSRHLASVLGLACVLTGGMDNNAFAKTVLSKSTRYYTIGGRTAAEIDRELATHGPTTRNSGSRHPGTTEIRFGGEISYAEEQGRCRVHGVRVTLSTRITLPRWKNRKRASREMALLWDTLAADIKRHEERHAEIARNHARRLDERLRSIPSSPSCAILQEKAAMLTERTNAEHDADQARFDKVEAINFEKRLMRMLRHKTAR